MAFSRSILVVDDEFTLRYTLSLILQRAGYNVKAAIDGREILKELQQEKFDLIILDIAMPEKDGIAVLSEIQQHYPHIPVVMLTAYPSSDTMHEARSYGARDYLVKPISPEKVLAVVRKVFEEPKHDC